VLFPPILDSSSYKWRQGRVTDSLEYTLRVTIELNFCQLHPEASLSQSLNLPTPTHFSTPHQTLTTSFKASVRRQASETAPKAAKFQIFRGRLLQPALLGVSRVTEEQNHY
jgi:hypothetical protein